MQLFAAAILNCEKVSFELARSPVVWGLGEVSSMADSDDSSNFFVKHGSTVRLALKDNLSLIRDELFKDGLIKPDVYDDIKDRNTKFSSSRMVDLVIDCLKDKVELSSKYLVTFYRIISSPGYKPHYDDILLKLKVEPG